jgi:uncharacterized repeat protein (TIGR03847 family)
MSSHFTYDFDPVQHIVADAVGKPGQRTFVLQASDGIETVSMVLEKQQVAALASSILQMLEELEAEHPNLPPVLDDDVSLELEQPIHVAFRVGQLGLGYDETRDLMVLVVQALVIPEEEPVEESQEDESFPSPDINVPKARFFATRAQMRALGEHALEVVAAGRPECPLCGEPIDPDGHFCPRTNGHAYPIAI